ncbi:MAG: hypothetical protein HN578_02190 [Rhodospirillales bacterium]|nr:hypothetical protein [Rhodospirillales bacterium]MBT3907975.1 hypothetical protein [Rhodospirillaceae bacterium]MBT5600374.1 hypothetical protein [Planctomycetaceae bacterium]MBT5036127.1 hypothetical protein [Rhodospirillaceae bacterium]MBT6221144.1 hypothetical protein [Rhodospirillaceae bacterium]
MTVVTGHEASIRARGSSVFGADADTMLMLKRVEKEMQVTLDMTKQKDAAEWETPKLIQLDTVHLSPEENSLVTVRPTAADAQKIKNTQLHQRSKHNPQRDPIVMDILDKAVEEVLASYPAKIWTTTDLAEAVAMREDIKPLSSTLKRRTLKDLREDTSRRANKLYDPATKRWIWRK